MTFFGLTDNKIKIKGAGLAAVGENYGLYRPYSTVRAAASRELDKKCFLFSKVRDAINMLLTSVFWSLVSVM